MYEIRFDKPISCGLQLNFISRVDFTTWVSKASVGRIFRVSDSSQTVPALVWLISRSLTMKPPFVPILVIAVVVPLTRKLRLVAGDVYIQCTLAKFDSLPSLDVSSRRCDDTIETSFSRFRFDRYLLSETHLYRGEDSRQRTFRVSLTRFMPFYASSKLYIYF